uniref:MFS domain-containing protein n=1 Tax=Caenorhabditis tropicalis TaxID=1561998 RepID=A0A1I7TW91_9PELO
MSLLRAYASTASTSEDRSRAIACVSGGIALGNMIGPGLQLLFTPFGAEGINVLGLTISIYTSPALFCLLLNGLGLLIVQFAFEEKYIIQHGKNVKEGEEDNGEVKKVNKIGNPDFIAVLLCVFTRFLQIFLNTTTESIGSAYLMMMFSLEKEVAVSVNAGIHTVGGGIAAAMFVSFIFTNFRKCFRMRLFTVISLIIPLIWLIATYPYSFYSDRVKIMVNGSHADCDLSKYSWCADQPKVNEYIYIGGYIMVFGIAYTIINITVTTIYSKVVGPRPQGTYQGIYQTAGSFGRMLAPILMSYSYTAYGPSVPWFILIVSFMILISAWIVLRERMVPFGRYETTKIEPSDQKI